MSAGLDEATLVADVAVRFDDALRVHHRAARGAPARAVGASVGTNLRVPHNPTATARVGSIFGAEADLLKLCNDTATHARRALLQSGDLVETDGGLVVVDLLLDVWLRQRFSF